jgi:hypothetical protein
LDAIRERSYQYWAIYGIAALMAFAVQLIGFFVYIPLLLIVAAPLLFKNAYPHKSRWRCGSQDGRQGNIVGRWTYAHW